MFKKNAFLKKSHHHYQCPDLGSDLSVSLKPLQSNGFFTADELVRIFKTKNFENTMKVLPLFRSFRDCPEKQSISAFQHCRFKLTTQSLAQNIAVESMSAGHDMIYLNYKNVEQHLKSI